MHKTLYSADLSGFHKESGPPKQMKHWDRNCRTLLWPHEKSPNEDSPNEKSWNAGRSLKYLRPN